MATANALKNLKGWILSRNYLNSIITQSPNTQSRLYINALGNSWTCICDDVVHSVKSWNALVCHMVQEEQTPVALLWTSRTYSERLELKLPSGLERAIESTVCGEAVPSGGQRMEEECNFWICPRCNEVNELTAMYCRKCLDMDCYGKLDITNPLEEIKRNRMFWQSYSY